MRGGGGRDFAGAVCEGEWKMHVIVSFLLCLGGGNILVCLNLFGVHCCVVFLLKYHGGLDIFVTTFKVLFILPVI